MKAPGNHTLLFTLLFVFCSHFTAFSQQKEVLLMNSKTFEIEAYKDIDGSPFYFPKWQLGKVYGKDAKENSEETYLLNFNGYTKSFEVRKDDRFINLDEKYYSQITIETEEAGLKKTTVFKTNSHPVYKNRFMKVVFEGTDFYVIQDYQVKLSNREKQGYAGNQNIQQFLPNATYYLVKKKKAKVLKLKKKSLINLFKDQESALKSFVKDNGLKMNNEAELVQFLSYYEQLTHPKSTVAANVKKN